MRRFAARFAATGRRRRHAQARDPPPRHLEHGGEVGADAHRVALARQAAEQRRHVAADRLLALVLRVGELEVEPVLDLRDRHAARRARSRRRAAWRAPARPRRTRRRAARRSPRARPRGTRARSRCRARRAPRRSAGARAAARAGSPRATSCPKRRAAGARARAGRASRRAARVEHVLRVQEAHDRVEPELAHGQARVPAGADPLEVLLERVLERHELDVDARHHDVAHLELDHPEHVRGELVLALGDVARARREREDAADLLGGGAVRGAEVGAQPDQAQQRVGDRVDRDDERAEQPRERDERRGRAQRDRLGAPQRPHLRRLLAERHVQHRDRP